MCNFFSCIVIRTGEVHFTEFESHEEVVSRSGLKDDLGHFVRIEYTQEAGYRVDEANIPEWYERVAAKAGRNVIRTYKKVAPAWKEYLDAELSALDAFEELRHTAWEEYESAKLTEENKHWEVERTAWDKLKKVRNTAKSEYQSVKRSALEAYKRAIVTIPGYLDQKVKEASE